MMSRMKTLLSLAVVGFVFSVNFAGAFSEDDLETKNIEVKEIADDVKLQNQESQYGIDIGNEESNEELDDDGEGDELDEEQLHDDESDKSDEEYLHDDEGDGDETDVEDDSSEVVKSSDPRFSPRFILGRIQRIARRVVPKFRIRPLKHKKRRNRHGVYLKYGITRFLGKLRRKNRQKRVKQSQFRKAHRKVKKLAKKIRLPQRKIRRKIQRKSASKAY